MRVQWWWVSGAVSLTNKRSSSMAEVWVSIAGKNRPDRLCLHECLSV